MPALEKKVTADKAAKGAGGSPKKTEAYKGVTSDDKKGQAKIADSNKRAITNRTNKGKAKKGEKYKYTKADGTTVMITKK